MPGSDARLNDEAVEEISAASTTRAIDATRAGHRPAAPGRFERDFGSLP
jgi:hypothetical protein